MALSTASPSPLGPTRVPSPTPSSGALASPSSPAESAASSADTYHASAAPEAPPSTEGTTVRVAFTPQDPATLATVETRIARDHIGATMSGPRVTMDDKTPAAAPDANGDYIFAPGTPGFQQANAFACTDKTLGLFEKYVGHEIKWAFEGPLKIHPHFKDGFNAFYLRLDHSVNFFDGTDNKLGVVMHGSESLDVVSHEVGHAVLDGMKPGLIGWFGSDEAKSFHESFGDVAAMLTALNEDTVLDALVSQTGGDLHKPNLVTALAEQFSRGVNDEMLGGRKPDDWTIRNANNRYVYQDPSTLPTKPGDPDVLTKEPHSFSQIFTGACWDIVAGMTAANKVRGLSTRDAIVAARDAFGPLYAHTVELGPDKMKSYSEMAKAMLVADQRYFNGQHAAIIGDVFTQRNIAHTDATAAPTRLPGLSLGSGAQTTLAQADTFLSGARQSLGVASDTPLTAEKVWSNDCGETFVRYGYTEAVDLDPHTFTEVGGTLTLGFGSDGALFHRMYEPVDDATRAEVRADAARVMARRSVALTAPTQASDLRRPDGMPFEAWIEKAGDRNKLVKVPMAS